MLEALIKQHVLVVKVQMFRLPKVIKGSRWSVIGATLQNHRASVSIMKLICVLPNIADHISHAEWRVSCWAVCGDWLGTKVRMSCGFDGIVVLDVCVSPGVHAAVSALRGILPLVAVGKATTRPRAVRTSF